LPKGKALDGLPSLPTRWTDDEPLLELPPLEPDGLAQKSVV
jgi:hypothetical protein